MEYLIAGACPLLAHSRHALVHCKCPLSGVKRHGFLRRKCPLMTQSGHLNIGTLDLSPTRSRSVNSAQSKVEFRGRVPRECPRPPRGRLSFGGHHEQVHHCNARACLRVVVGRVTQQTTGVPGVPVKDQFLWYPFWGSQRTYPHYAAEWWLCPGPATSLTSVVHHAIFRDAWQSGDLS